MLGVALAVSTGQRGVAEQATLAYQDGPVAAAAIVKIHSDPIATTDPVVLGDIAEIESAETHLAEALRSLAIGRAALPAEQRLFNVGTLRVRMRQAGLPESKIRIIAPAYAFPVKTGLQHVSASLLKAYLAEAVRVQLSLPSETSIEINLETGSALHLPPGEVRVELQGVTGSGKESDVRFKNQPGMFSFLATLLVNGQPTRQLPFYARVHPPVHSASTERPGGPGALTQSGSRSGPSGTGASSPGSVITHDRADPSDRYPAGTPVHIVARVGGLTVSAPGVLVNAGSVGETVRVRNVSSGQIINGELGHDGQVFVPLP